MPRNGTVNLNNAKVVAVLNQKQGTSRVLVQDQGWTVTFERSGSLPENMELAPDDTIDIKVGFDQRVKAP